MTDSTIRAYKAWDFPTRLFHWINFLCVLLLSIVGLIMLNKGTIGIGGNEARIGLKILHVLIGYVFAANLVFRLLWGFIGGGRSSWKALLPGKYFKTELKNYKASLAAGKPQTFIGHNPKGRLAILVMFTLMTVMMVTGMVRAGTDIYYPPFGSIAADFVAAEGVSPEQIKPYNKTGTDADKLAELKAFKGPFGKVHVYGAYLLWFLVLIHIIAVIRADAGDEGTLISAMFSGKKHLPREPEDL